MRKFLLISLVGLLSYFPSFANRGDIISYEQVRDWDAIDFTEHFWREISGMVPDESKDSVKVIFASLVNELMSDKNLLSYKVIYKTIDHYGNPTQASGLVVLPSYFEKTCSLPVFLYGHGTIFNREGAPSRPQNWGLESFFTYLAAGSDYIGVAPDYYGLGDGPGFHHHNSNQTNASSSIDMIRAGRKLAALKDIGDNGQVFISGYSEGGHNAMGVLKMVHTENLQSEFKIVSAGCGSGAYDMSGLSYNYIVNDPYYPTRAYILYLLGTCEDIYGNLIKEEEGESISTYLNAPYDSLYQVHLLGQDGNMGWVPLPWTDLFAPGQLESVKSNPEHPLRQCLKKASLFDWPNPYQTHLYFAKTDAQVYWRNAPKARNYQQKYIPWYRFWDRFRISTHDMTMGGDIASHEAAAIPIMLHYFIISSPNNKFSCINSGREAIPVIDNGYTMNYDRSVEIPVSAFPGLQKVELVNFLKFHATNLDMQQEKAGVYHLQMPDVVSGVYLLRLTDAQGKLYYRWQIIEDPEFVETDDYNPVMQGTHGSYLLDLTLLEDNVSKVVLYSAAGKKISSFDDPFMVQELAASGTLADGEYVVQVHGSQRLYHLKMQVGKQAVNTSVSVSPNPFSNTFVVEAADNNPITGIRIYSADGREHFLPQQQGESKWTVNAASLPAGLYLVKITDKSGIRTEKVIKL